MERGEQGQESPSTHPGGGSRDGGTHRCDVLDTGINWDRDTARRVLGLQGQLAGAISKHQGPWRCPGPSSACARGSHAPAPGEELTAPPFLTGPTSKAYSGPTPTAQPRQLLPSARPAGRRRAAPCQLGIRVPCIGCSLPGTLWASPCSVRAEGFIQTRAGEACGGVNTPAAVAVRLGPGRCMVGMQGTAGRDAPAPAATAWT